MRYASLLGTIIELISSFSVIYKIKKYHNKIAPPDWFSRPGNHTHGAQMLPAWGKIALFDVPLHPLPQIGSRQYQNGIAIFSQKFF